ncbi:MAG: tetratricopeptide repeat protein [Edaphobacter sp.]
MSISPRQLGLPLVVLLALLSAARLYAADNAQANALLQQGKVDQASALLQSTLAAQPKDALAHLLLCRVYYAQDMIDPAVHECEQAAAQAPNDSDTQMWLGRAYGLKASHVNKFSAFGYAKKVRTAFERSVQLGPANVHAMSDLGEFYVAAPGIVGGGVDKAQALAAKIQARFPAESHRILAMIAEKKENVAAAEAEFKAAAAVGKSPDAYVDLGHFYERQNQPDKVMGPLQAAIDADHRKDAALVDVASILIASHRSPELAEGLLRAYLSSAARSDAAPAFKVHVQLGDLLARRGDSAGAHREYAAAVAMASHYEPARKALKGS